MTVGCPCSSPGCGDPAAWAVLSETERVGDRSEWGLWTYVGTLACDGHRDAAEDEAFAKQKHYRLIPIPLNAWLPSEDALVYDLPGSRPSSTLDPGTNGD
jgi:hypothetical protein